MESLWDAPEGSEKLERSLRLAEEAGLDEPVTRAYANLDITRLRARRARARTGRRGDPGVWPLLDEALALAEPTEALPWLTPVATARG